MAITNETTARITRINRTGYTFKAEGEGGAALEVQGMTIHINDGVSQQHLGTRDK